MNNQEHCAAGHLAKAVCEIGCDPSETQYIACVCHHGSVNSGTYSYSTLKAALNFNKANPLNNTSKIGHFTHFCIYT